MNLAVKNALQESLTDRYVKLPADLRAAFRPQREWAEGQGLWLLLAFFCSGVGAGTWLFSAPAFFDVPAGLVIGLLLMVAGSGGAHLAFLGHPLRAWRMVAQFRTSWVSRGIVGIMVFTIPAVLYLVPSVFPGVPWRQDDLFGKALMALSIFGALWVATYKGFVFAVAKGIPFWNSPLLPPLFIAYALRGGLAVLLLIGALGGKFAAFHSVEVVKLWTVVSSAALIVFYVWVMSDAGLTARQSAREIINGRVSLVFYVGVVAGGIVVPLVGGCLAFFTDLSLGAVGLIGVCSLVGDFSVTYSIAKAGIYLPPAFGALSGVR